MKEHYVIGIDCGSLSARAVVARVSDGQLLACAQASYPHGIVTGRLPNGTPLPEGFVLTMAEDYLAVLPRIVAQACAAAGITPEKIIGIGVDATSCTVVPCTAEGIPLCLLEPYQKEPHAHIKLWKHHCVQPQAERIAAAARQRQEPFLERFGGEVSCEWMLPKVLQIREEAPALFQKTALYLDLCDFLTFRMTGRLTRCANSVGFKGLWSPGQGDLSAEFLDLLAPDFGRDYTQKVLSGPVVMHGRCCGHLTASAARWLGLAQGTAVSSGIMDGHASLIALGLKNAGDLGLIIGTSNAIPFLADHFAPVKGLCGTVENGLVEGLWACTAGQIATGDMLDWFVHQSLPPAYHEEAKRLGISPHELLSQKAAASHPQENRLTVLDWWNGNRSILCNQQLTGAMVGLTLHTKPEEIYCAMLQGIACGTRVIIDQCRGAGLEIRTVTACGGIPGKNPFFMQQYANILAMPVRTVTISDSSALGSAICAAAAAGVERGGYDRLGAAMDRMHIRETADYFPQKEYTAQYDAIYRRYRRLYHTLGSRHP